VNLIGLTIFGLKFFIIVIVLAFICEFINAIFGGGHGTILTPLLIMLGFSPLTIVPSVLLAEVISGVLVGMAHHKVGNVNFGKNSHHLKIAILLSILSIIGVLMAVMIAINVSTSIIELYIGLLIFFLGIIILLTMQKKFKFSWSKLMALGVFASFNKGLSGAGYGPLVTAGQILTGTKSKHAVSITSLAKGVTSGFGVIAYFFLGGKISWILAPSLITGAIISVPFTAFFVKKMDDKSLRIIIGLITALLGLLTIIKVFSGKIF